MTIKELENKIKDAAQKYYGSGTSELTDEEFDNFVAELREKNPNSELFGLTAWGYDVNSIPGNKYEHKYGKAGSLEKAYSYQEIQDRLLNRKVQISLKLDGISAVLYYRNGKLYQALTRGNGFIGVDFTDKAKKFVPEVITDGNFTGAVRGEIIMDTDGWKVYNGRHPEAKNSRNSVAGLINQKEISEDLDCVKIVLYSIVGCETERFNGITNIHNWLNENFNEIVPACYYDRLTENIVKNFETCRNTLNSIDGNLKYPVDGIVIKAEDIEINGNSVSEIAQAYKFDAESEITEVENVEWNVSKTRYLIPRVKVKTVHISGTDVTYCTGYNAQFIKEKGIGKGAVVRISKHGEIIPGIDEVITAVNPDLPVVCPTCGGEIKWNGVHLVCENPDCEDATWHDTWIWFSNLVPVFGFKESLLKKYLDNMTAEGIIADTTIESIMKSDYRYTATGNIGKQDKQFTEIWNNIHTVKFDLVNVLSALNIPRLGETTSRLLASRPEVVKALIANVKNGKAITDGVEMAWFGDANTASLIANAEKFKRILFIENQINFAPKANTGNVFVAVTGKLSVERAKFKEELKNHGFILKDMTKDTKFLITDSPNSGSAKNVKADRLGIEKITESDFRARFMA